MEPFCITSSLAFSRCLVGAGARHVQGMFVEPLSSCGLGLPPELSAHCSSGVAVGLRLINQWTELLQERAGPWRNYFIGVIGTFAPDEDDVLWPNQVPYAA